MRREAGMRAVARACGRGAPCCGVRQGPRAALLLLLLLLLLAASAAGQTCEFHA